MANTTQVIDMVAKEALAIAHEKITFLGTVNRTYDDSFARTGAKIGDTLRIRLPNQFTRRQGSRVMDVQDIDEAVTTITVATQDGVDMRFNSAELSLAAESKEAFSAFSERYIDPAVSVLVSGIESDMIAKFSKAIYNLVGTAGTVVGTDGNIEALGLARAALNRNLAPKDSMRAVQLDSITMAKIVNGTKSLFQDSTQIKEAFREGFISRNAMADWYENERTWTLTNAGDVAGNINSGTIADGMVAATVNNFSAAPTEGMVFTIASVNAVHPETKADTGQLQQFVVGTGSTTTNLVFTPAIYASGAKKNVTALPGTTAAITFHGSASTAYRQNLMYHRDAFAFVTADLPLMDGADKCVRREMDGLSLRVWSDGDIRNDELLCRIDILYGGAAIRPAWGCRISN